MTSKSEIQKTAEHWNRVDTGDNEGHFWSSLPAVQSRLNHKVSGSSYINWLQYTLENHFAHSRPIPEVLSLGCGTGSLERQLAQLNGFISCTGVDIADNSIQRASQLAQAVGNAHVKYEVRDINAIELQPSCYGAVWAHNSVHHFSALEHVFAQVARSLKPDGLFVLHEYIGANRFQFPLRQRQIIEACYELIPQAYRQECRPSLADGEVTLVNGGIPSTRWLMGRVVDKMRDGSLLPAVKRRLHKVKAHRQGISYIKNDVNLPTESSVIALDPSESIRSAEIMPVLKQYFDIVEFKPLGGSILQFLLSDITCNFKGENGKQLLEMFFAIEDAFMVTGELSSDFAYIVARPKRLT
jgi:SAM-dependent methyltransferase